MILNLDFLKDISGVTPPSSSQSAQIRVISGFSSTLNGLASAGERMISVRKAHLSETTASAPIDDTATPGLSDGIRRLIGTPFFAWRASHNAYFISLTDALSEDEIDLPALTGYYADLQTALELIVSENDDHGFIPTILNYLKFSTTPSWLIPNNIIRDTIDDETVGNCKVFLDDGGYLNFSGYSSSATIGTIRTQMETIDDDGQNLATQAYAGYNAGYAGAAPSLPGVSDVTDMRYAMSYLNGALNKLFVEIDAGNAVALGSTKTTPLSLITYMASTWKAVRDWAESDLSTYLNDSVDLFNDELDGYLDSL